VENTRIHQLSDGGTRFERRIELDQGDRPKQALSDILVNLGVDPAVADEDEAADVRSIVIDQALAESEDIHAKPPRYWS
jgi:hypothetical protein